MGKAKRYLGNQLPRNDRLNKALGRQSNTLRSQNITPASQLTGIPNNDFLKSSGALHSGADGFISQVLTIDTGILDLQTSAVGDIVKVRKYININPESGTTDTLDLIASGGTEFPQQELVLVGQSGDTITIDHNNGSAAGNNRAILCPGAVDYTLNGTDAVALFYDFTLSKWRIEGDATSGGGGGVSFPIEPTVLDFGAGWTGTEELKLEDGDGHIYKWTVDQDLTFVASVTGVPASGTQRTFELEFVHDEVGGTFTVTLPTSPAFVDENGNTLASFDIATGRAILSCRVNEGSGGNIIVMQKNVTTVTGGGSQTPWLSNIDADDFDLSDLANLNFSNTGAPNNTVSTIFSSIPGDMIFNVASGKQFGWSENGIDIGGLDNGRFIVQTVDEDGPDIILNNNDQTPLDNDIVGQIKFVGNDDAIANVDYGVIEFEMNDVSAGASQASFKVHCQSTNSLDPIIDYSGSDGVFRMSSGVDVFRANRDNGVDLGSVSQSWKNGFFTGYVDFKALATPADPGTSTTRRLFTDSASGELSVRTGAGTTVSLEAGAAGGEANTASNLGAGSGVFGTKVSSDLRFKSLVPGTGISFATDANEIEINTNAYIDGGGADLDMSNGDVDDATEINFGTETTQSDKFALGRGSDILTLQIGATGSGASADTFRIRRGTSSKLILDETGWQFANDGIGFYGATPTAQQTGVAVTAAGIHAALVTLGLITA